MKRFISVVLLLITVLILLSMTSCTAFEKTNKQFITLQSSLLNGWQGTLILNRDRIIAIRPVRYSSNNTFCVEYDSGGSTGRYYLTVEEAQALFNEMRIRMPDGVSFD